MPRLRIKRILRAVPPATLAAATAVAVRSVARERCAAAIATRWTVVRVTGERARVCRRRLLVPHHS